MAKEVKNQVSFLKTLTGSDLSFGQLAFICRDSGLAGPTIWLTAGAHGDELGGIVIIQEILKRLEQESLLRGRLYVLPLMNPIGFLNGSLDAASRGLLLNEENLNRAFPGDLEGSFAERIAAKIFSTIIETKPSLVLDLHNDWVNSIPYILIDSCPSAKHRAVYETTKKFSQQTGLTMVNEPKEKKNQMFAGRTLAGSLLSRQIPALTLELGGAYLVDEQQVTEGVKAIWNVLFSLKMVKDRASSPTYCLPVKLRGKDLYYFNQPLAKSVGITRFLVEPGELVKKGVPIARVYDVFGGLRETLTALKTGVVLGRTNSSASLPGMEIFAFGA